MSGWGGISSSEMAAIDENSEWLGVSRELLMENAGAWVARIAYQWLGGLSKRKVTIICGTGNNGGDGFVAARHAANLGAKVVVILVGGLEKIRTVEARKNFEIIKSMRESIRLYIVKDLDDVALIRDEIEKSDAIIDAIFGTGIRGEIREPWRSIIQLINSSKALKIAVDIPSGIDPNTGEASDIAVNANVTVTFHRPKLGMPSAADYCGEVVIAPIGIPPEAEIIMGPGDARQALKAIGGESRDILLLDELDDRARDLLTTLGASYSFEGDPANKVVFIGRRLDKLSECKDAFSVMAFGLDDLQPNLVAIADWKEASSKLGIDLRGNLIEKHEQLIKASSAIDSIIYVLGEEADILLGNSRWKASWINRPLKDEGISVLVAASLALTSKGIERFHALSAAGYLAGYASKLGYEAVIEEIERLRGKS